MQLRKPRGRKARAKAEQCQCPRSQGFNFSLVMSSVAYALEVIAHVLTMIFHSSSRLSPLARAALTILFDYLTCYVLDPTTLCLILPTSLSLSFALPFIECFYCLGHHSTMIALQRVWVISLVHHCFIHAHCSCMYMHVSTS
jgi:hypothetical protein